MDNTQINAPTRVRPQDIGVKNIIAAGHGAQLSQYVSRLIQTYGLPPSSPEIAAYHEAGHVVLGVALGGKFKEAYITHTTGWEGYSNVKIPGVHGNKDIQLHSEPERGWLIALNQAAGCVGEELVGLGHPSSSPEETFSTMNICATLASVFKVDQDDLGYLMSLHTLEVLGRNRKPFEAIAQTLLAKKRITNKEIATQPWVFVPQTAIVDDLKAYVAQNSGVTA
jgi:hypothetical protein